MMSSARGALALRDEDLHGAHRAERGVARPVDDTHAALAEDVDHLVGPEPPAHGNGSYQLPALAFGSRRA
jgi:hypothetical protein